MLLDPRFVIISSIVDLSGTLAYAWDTFKGRTQPNRVSWLLWTIVPFITFFAQLSIGVGWPIVLTFAIAIGPAAVVLGSFLNKQAYWRITKFDLWCGILSVLAIILWLVTKTGLIAIILSIAADFLAGIPTIIKAYHHPDTESANAYLAGIFSGSTTLLTIQNWNFSNYGFPLYILAFCSMIVILIKFPKLRFTMVAST